MPVTLAEKSCTPCRGGIPPLTEQEAAAYHAQAPDWALLDQAKRIERTYRFKNFARSLRICRARGCARRSRRPPSRHRFRLGLCEGSRCRPKRSKDCTRTISSWRQSSIASPPRAHAEEDR